MQVTEEMAVSVSALSRLDLPESEREQVRQDLQTALQWMDKLSDVMSLDAPADADMDVRLRADTVCPPMARTLLLQNARDTQDGYVVVPSAVLREDDA